MRIKPTRQDRDIGQSIYRRFKQKPGSDHIASAFALAHLSALLQIRPIGSVLEFGAGIGTITALLIDALPRDALIVCAERDAWCRDQFASNVDSSRVTLLPSGRPDVSQAFDLVIVDGPVSQGSDFLREGSLLFCEGNRDRARTGILDSLSRHNLRCDVTHHLPFLGLFSRGKGCWVGRVTAAPSDTPA